MVVGLAKMEANQDYYLNLSYESNKAKFEEHVYTSKSGQLFGERVVNNKRSQSPMLVNSNVANAQGLHGLNLKQRWRKFLRSLGDQNSLHYIPRPEELPTNRSSESDSYVKLQTMLALLT